MSLIRLFMKLLVIGILLLTISRFDQGQVQADCSGCVLTDQDIYGCLEGQGSNVCVPDDNGCHYIGPCYRFGAFN
jgi:hypothetical protein